MFRQTRVGIVCGVFLLVLSAVPVHAGDLPASEKAKIEALLQHVATLTEAVFIRNHQTYASAIAARFLRDKWAASFAAITTATDFIEHIASVSSTSGLPYCIRFPDGREVPSGEYLRAALKQLEH